MSTRSWERALSHRAAAAVLVLVGSAGCGSEPKPAPPPPHIKVDGSSTVFTISRDVAERYKRTSKTVVDVVSSGTGAGFKKLCSGEVAIAGASRPIAAEEVADCHKAGIELIELPVAFDGIAVVVHPDNTWLTSLTIPDLRRLLDASAEGKIVKWSDFNPAFPAVALHVVGPPVGSGTHDYLERSLLESGHKMRRDILGSEDDFELVDIVKKDGLAIGFFGYAYYISEKDRLKLIGVDDGNPENGEGPITPSRQSISDATYQPLSRPVFIYVNAADTKKPEVDDFVLFYMDVVRDAVHKVGYVPLPKKVHDLVAERYVKRITGSTFSGIGVEVGVTIESLYQAETVSPVTATTPR